MHGLYIAEIYRPGAIFLPLIVWVYFQSLLYSELRKKKIYRVFMVVQDHPMS